MADVNIGVQENQDKIINIQNPSISALSKDSANENGIGNDVLEQRAEIERRAAKKILSYVLIFIMQWVPVQISAAARFFSVSKI
uniref:Uncharacterized protein n=1 Tax=Rhizophagus irregularis (strain DAOM 181602 / DAOM 197198 / MUCL 43194) TaxID=747089 RepID=U9UCP8_RHIID